MLQWSQMERRLGRHLLHLRLSGYTLGNNYAYGKISGNRKTSNKQVHFTRQVLVVQKKSKTGSVAAVKCAESRGEI